MIPLNDAYDTYWSKRYHIDNLSHQMMQMDGYNSFGSTVKLLTLSNGDAGKNSFA